MEHLSNALPASPEQWAAAISTLVGLILALLRKRQRPVKDERDPRRFPPGEE